MSTLDLLGHPTWYTVQGAGDETVLLLHGGLSNSDAMLDSIGGLLDEHRRVAAFDRRGHGRTADTPEAFHYESMVDETIAFIDHIGGPVHIVGWSDGGIIGLLLALRRPELIGRLVAIGANYHWDVLPDLSGPAADSGDGTREVEAGDDGLAALMAAEYAERSPHRQLPGSLRQRPQRCREADLACCCPSQGTSGKRSAGPAGFLRELSRAWSSSLHFPPVTD